MTESNDEEKKPSKITPLIGWVVLGAFALVAYQMFLGGGLKNISIPGIFGAEFHPPEKEEVKKPKETAVKPELPVNPVVVLEASREFFTGRWEVDQVAGAVSGDTRIDYNSDGSYSGTMSQFQGGVGMKIQVTGNWELQKKSKNSFVLTLNGDDGSNWRGEFDILGPNKIHNVKDNYIAIRTR